MDNSFVITTPVGKLRVTVNQTALLKLELNSDAPLKSARCEFGKLLSLQIDEYFLTARHHFEVPIMAQGTAFQNRVWELLSSIPCGEVWTYGQVAKKLNTSARAVGNACRNNPTPIVVPCHRVVSASGLGGFAGKTNGVLSDIKRDLLTHEGVVIGS